MKDRLLPFVIGNNLFPIALIALAVIAYLKYAPLKPSLPSMSSTKPTVTGVAPVPKYVEKIIEKHHYLPSSVSRIEYLPKHELEDLRPGSVAPDVLQDNLAQIVARTEVPPSHGKTQVDAIRLDDPGGTVKYRLDYRQLPPKFFDLKQEYRMGIYAGVGSEGGTLLEGELRVLPLRIGPVETVAKARLGWGDKDGTYGAVLVGIEF